MGKFNFEFHTSSSKILYKNAKEIFS